MTKVKEGISPDGKLMHYGVGAVIEREGRYLLIDRAVEPLGYGCVSGHINEKETPAEALIREVREEIDLEVVDYELIFEREINNRECSTGKISHYCYIFKCRVKGEIKINLAEIKSADWNTKDEIKEKKSKLEPVWKFFFKKTRVI